MGADKKAQIIDRDTLVIIIIVIVLSAGWLFYRNIKNQGQDVNFARRVFVDLTRGRHSVQSRVDWQNLQAVGVDVGKDYSSLPNDKERADYQRAFIDNFALSFRRTGGSLKLLTNWRIYDDQDDLVIVAVDIKGRDKTMFFTFSKKGGEKKLVAIELE